jgi:AcrR family transcriptional regulator
MAERKAVLLSSPTDKTAPRRACKKAKTRELIAAAAMRLFAAKGFEETTIAEIAREADVAEQTVYNFFSQGTVGI